MLSFEDFKDECATQSVELVPALLKAGQGDSASPTEMLLAIRRAGRLLREDEPEALADGIIEPTAAINEDVAALTLTNMVNDSTTANVTAAGLVVNSRNNNYMNVCADAELRFADTFRYLSNPLDKLPSRGAEIIHTDGHPQLIRKSFHEKSALALEPLTIRGIRYPAGSIVGVGMVHDFLIKRGVRRPGIPLVAYDRFKALQSTDVTSATFHRLSAFALAPEDRKPFTIGFSSDVDKAAAREIARNWSIYDIRELAAQAVAALTDVQWLETAMVE